MDFYDDVKIVVFSTIYIVSLLSSKIAFCYCFNNRFWEELLGQWYLFSGKTSLCPIFALIQIFMVSYGCDDNKPLGDYVGAQNYNDGPLFPKVLA